MSDLGQAVAGVPFIYGRIWFHWIDTPEVRGLGGNSFRIWILLHVHAAGHMETDPFRDALEQESGIAAPHLRAIFRELEEAGLLRREIDQGYGAKGRKSTVYHLLTPPSAREREAQAQEVLHGGRKASPEQVPNSEQAKGDQKPISDRGRKLIPDGDQKPISDRGRKLIPSQDPSQDNSSQDTQKPVCVDSDSGEVWTAEDQAYHDRELEIQAAYAERRPRENTPGTPVGQNAQVRGPTSPEWPDGAPSAPSSADPALPAGLRIVEPWICDKCGCACYNGSRSHTCLPNQAAGPDQLAGANRAQVQTAPGTPGGQDAQVVDRGVSSRPAGSTFPLPPRLQKQADARHLVETWLQEVRKFTRDPHPAEIAFAMKLYAALEADKRPKEEIWEVVRQADQELQQAGLLNNTQTFCGLKTVIKIQGVA